jgi:hypothetical protein
MSTNDRVVGEEADPVVPSRGVNYRCADAGSVESITTMRPGTDIASFLGGFTAAEGSFIVTGRPLTFTFSVGLGAADRDSCEMFRDFLGCGHLVWSPRRKPHYDDEVAFHVRKLADLVYVVVPFMDEHLPLSYKWQQFQAWRTQLLDYWEHSAKRRRPCTVEGCDEPRRAKGLCRRHYYAEFGC